MQTLNKEGLNDKEIDNYENYTSLIITINHLRNFISNITSYGPLGKYVLPSIDMTDLINQKIKQGDSLSDKRALIVDKPNKKIMRKKKQ